MKQLMQPGDIVIINTGEKFECVTQSQLQEIFNGMKPINFDPYYGYNVVDHTYLSWNSSGQSICSSTDKYNVKQVIPKEKPMQAKQPRKHSELIKAWADGAEIEEYCRGNGGHWDYRYDPDWTNEDAEYRIKPEVKPDVITSHYATSHHVFKPLEDERYPDNLKLTFDGETGKLKSAEVIETE